MINNEINRNLSTQRVLISSTGDSLGMHNIWDWFKYSVYCKPSVLSVRFLLGWGSCVK